MGDRIAVMQAGGILAQYATPAELLMVPASPFVEDFVGTDRALKRLALQRVRDVELEPAPEPLSLAATPLVRLDDTLRDALSAMLAEEAQQAPVLDGDGRVAGLLSIDALAHALQADPA
jgi:osmoprotectant transport system ATP-binding protein